MKKFDEWSDLKTVDCEDCEHWWDNTCDGLPLRGSERLCTAFLATRQVLIPLQIKSLQKSVKWLKRLLCVLGVLVVVMVGYVVYSVLV